MSDNITLTEDIIKLKVKVMLQKINKLYKICEMLLNGEDFKKINSLKVIKEQYLRMYETLIEKGEYEKYREIEDVIVRQISKIELDIDKYIYETIQEYNEIIVSNIEKIKKSEEYKNFNNMNKALEKIQVLKELLKLYSPYISKNEIERLQYEITTLKFDILLRRQVEQLIYENGGTKSNLLQYDDEKEKNIFIKLLEEKIKSLTVFDVETIENDEILRIQPKDILKNSELLERLIIIDMKKNPYNYINLLKAKIFNAHLCNIGNNPFEKEVYLTEEQYRKNYMNYGKYKDLKADKVNYSLLVAILKGLITDENISIIECENLYKKFGFECKTILTKIGQQCVKMIFEDVKKNKELIAKFSQELRKNKKSQESKYCKIYFKGLSYEFDNEEKKSESLLKQILGKRKIKTTQEMTNRRLFSKKQEILETKDCFQEKKEEVKKYGTITTDINVIILLINDIIDKYNEEIQRLKQNLKNRLPKDEEKFWLSDDKTRIEIYEAKICAEKRDIEWLKELKNKNEKLTLEEIRKLLLTINDIYRKLDISYNERKLLPLEDMESKNSEQVYFVPIPEEREVIYSFKGFKRKEQYYYKSDITPLWKKYQMEFKNLGIDIKKYGGCYDTDEPDFKICVNLDNISDLPIDYEKVKFLTKEELEEIIEKEERNEK